MDGTDANDCVNGETGKMKMLENSSSRMMTATRMTATTMMMMTMTSTRRKMMSPECQRCQTPRVGAVRPSSRRHTRQVGPVEISWIG